MRSLLFAFTLFFFVRASYANESYANETIFPQLTNELVCHVFIGDVDPLAELQLDGVTHERVTDEQTVTALSRRVFGGDAKLRAQLNAFFVKMVEKDTNFETNFQGAPSEKPTKSELLATLRGGTLEPLIRYTPLWELYLHIYVRGTVYCSEFLRMSKAALSYFPQGRRFADLGCGPGIDSSLLLLQNPKASLTAVDRSCSLANKTLGALGAFLARGLDYQVNSVNLDKLEVDSLVGKYDGILLKNVLYALSKTGQVSLLNRVANHLTPNTGRFVLASIDADKQPDKLGAKVILDALSNGAPITQTQLVVVQYIIKEILTHHTPPYLTYAEQMDVISKSPLKHVIPPVRGHYFDTEVIHVLGVDE